MQIQNLQSKTPRHQPARVGRGGKRGKTAGRGTKGQKARAGHKIRPEFRDLIKKIPKKRGYRFQSFAKKVQELNLDVLEKSFGAGETVSPATLAEKRLVKKNGGVIKVLAGGNLTKSLIVSGCALSASARAKIEAVGGSIK